MKFNITDLSGHTFNIGFRWSSMKRFDFELVGLMKYHIEEYYDDKLENDFLLENNLTNHDINNHYDEYFASDY